MRTGVVASLLLSACVSVESESEPLPPTGLAALAAARLDVSPGPTAMVSIERACEQLDDSFGGSYGGLPLTIVQYGGATSRSCASAYGVVDIAGRELAHPFVELHDRETTMIATFDPPTLADRVLALRSHAEWRFAPGETVRLGWPRPGELAAAVDAYVGFVKPDEVHTFTVHATLAADELSFVVPATAPASDGTLLIGLSTSPTPALACEGISRCELTGGIGAAHAASIAP